MEFTGRERRILIAALELPSPFGVRALTETIGLAVSLKEAEALVIEGLMSEDQQPAPKKGEPMPPRRFYLTADGVKVATDMKRHNPLEPDHVPQEQLARMVERFGNGEGGDTRTQVEIARDLGLSVITVHARHKAWVAGELQATLAPEPDPVPPAPLAPEEVATSILSQPIPAGRIQGLKKDMLYARFDAGEGFDDAGKERLAKLFGVTPGAIGPHLTDWRRARGLAGTAAPRLKGPVGEIKQAAPAVQMVPKAVDPRRVHLCDTCAHRQVCRFAPLEEEAGEIEAGAIVIGYGIRPVNKCSGYLEEAAS